MIRAGFLSGVATITANGRDCICRKPRMTAAGGGGAGGNGYGAFRKLAAENGLTVNVNGGKKGGNANSAVVFRDLYQWSFTGPGGGGGAGMIISFWWPWLLRIGMAAGSATTETSLFEWGRDGRGATGRDTNQQRQILPGSGGVRSGVECAAPDCIIDKSHVGNWIHGSGWQHLYDYGDQREPVGLRLWQENTVTVVDTIASRLDGDCDFLELGGRAFWAR